MASHSSCASGFVIIGRVARSATVTVGRIDAAQPPGVKRRPFAGVRQQRAQPLGLVVLDLFPRPVQAPDVILEGGLHGRADAPRAAVHMLSGAFVTAAQAGRLPGSDRPNWVRRVVGPWFGNGARVSGATLIGARVVGELVTRVSGFALRGRRLRRRSAARCLTRWSAAPRSAPPTPWSPAAGRDRAAVSVPARSSTAGVGSSGESTGSRRRVRPLQEQKPRRPPLPRVCRG